MINLFKKKKKEEKEDKKNSTVSEVEPKFETEGRAVEIKPVEGKGIIESFYVSEKASHLIALNQYMFRVSRAANKQEVRKQIEKMFNVKVKDVKMINMPAKKRTFGRHSGQRPGYRKAIVILKEGYTISQAKP